MASAYPCSVVRVAFKWISKAHVGHSLLAHIIDCFACRVRKVSGYSSAFGHRPMRDICKRKMGLRA